jgi:hypothetical protein
MLAWQSRGWNVRPLYELMVSLRIIVSTRPCATRSWEVTVEQNCICEVTEPGLSISISGGGATLDITVQLL